MASGAREQVEDAFSIPLGPVSTRSIEDLEAGRREDSPAHYPASDETPHSLADYQEANVDARDPATIRNNANEPDSQESRSAGFWGRLWPQGWTWPQRWTSKRESYADSLYGPITHELEDYPIGYPRLAKFMSDYQEFGQYRSFTNLHARVLLAQQYDIERLERELDQLDCWEAEEGDAVKLSCKRRDDRYGRIEDMPDNFPFKRTRPDVLADVKGHLMEYDKILLLAKQVSSMQSPSDRDWRSLRNWTNTVAPLVDTEMQFIMRKDDLVSLNSGREKADLDNTVAALLTRLGVFLFRRMSGRLPKLWFANNKARSGFIQVSLRPDRVDAITNVIVTFVLFALLILPVVAIYELSKPGVEASPFAGIGVLLFFTLIFCVAMSVMTKATRESVFAASAAYCGIMLVFITNFGTQRVEVVK